jgi:hypothetical protein
METHARFELRTSLICDYEDSSERDGLGDQHLVFASVTNALFDEGKTVSYYMNPWKQFCPLILQAASKYPVYSVEQLPRNSNKCL